MRTPLWGRTLNAAQSIKVKMLQWRNSDLYIWERMWGVPGAQYDIRRIYDRRVSSRVAIVPTNGPVLPRSRHAHYAKRYS